MADIYGFSPGLQELSDRAALTGELGVLGQIRNQAPSVPFIPRSPFPAPWGQAFDLGQFPGHSINPVQPWQSLQFRPNAGVVGQRPALAQPMGMQDMGNWQDPRGALAPPVYPDQHQDNNSPAKVNAPNTGTQQPSMGTDPAAAAAAQAQHAQQSQDSDAWRWGLLAAGLGILANNSGHYGAAGPALGKGGMMGVQTYLGLKQNEKEDALKREHMAQTKAYQDKQLGLQERGVAVTEGKLANEVAKLKQQQEIALALAGDDPQMMRIAMAEPEKFIEFQLARRKPDYKEREIRNGDQARQEFSLDGGQNWSPVPGGGAYNMRAARGGTDISLKVGEKQGEAFTKPIAEQVDASYSRATSAVESQNVVNRISARLNDGKVIAGIGANQRMAAAQFMDLLGVDAKGLAETRSVIQGLSELTLKSRGLLKGQGQVTDRETTLLEKAQSGSIDFTPTELKELVNVFTRMNRAQYDAHGRVMKRLEGVQGGESAGVFYQPDPFPDSPAAPPVKRYNPATGKIE